MAGSNPPAEAELEEILSGITPLERPISGWVVRSSSQGEGSNTRSLINRYGRVGAGRLIAGYIWIFFGGIIAIAGFISSSINSDLLLPVLGASFVLVGLGVLRVISSRSAAKRFRADAPGEEA